MKLFSKNISSRSDEELVVMLNGNKSHEALTELHTRYSKKVLGFFVRMFNGDKDKSQDFVQDLFIRILEKHHLFDPSKKFYTWMFTIASNMCKTEFRKKQNARISDDDYELNNNAEWDDDLSDKALFNAQLKASISQLESNHREAFVLRHVQGMSIAEIAEIMDVSTGTVKSRVFYSTKKIAQQLQEFKPGEQGQLFKIS